MSPFKRVGVRGRLLLAFLAISGFALIAAGAALYAFDRAGTVLKQITQERLPPALAALALARQAERIVAAAPALLATTNQAQRQTTYSRVADEVTQLAVLLAELEVGSKQLQQLISVRIAPFVLNFEGNLDDLDFMVEQRLDLANRRDELTTQFTATLRASQRLIAPGASLIDMTLDRWIVNSRQSPASMPSDAEAINLIETLRPLLPQRKAEVIVASINDLFLQISTAETLADISSSEQTAASLIAKLINRLKLATTRFPDAIRADMEQLNKTFESIFIARDGLIAIRQRELASLSSARKVLADNAELAKHLTLAVNSLVDISKQDIQVASANALKVQALSSAILITVVVLSLISAGLITWLYVDRNLVARLKALSDSMLAIASGNLRAPLPAQHGSDEIGQMAAALTVFRDTAVEVEENNLRNIAQARSRLIDALESSSEGFAFFDADDRLELSNTRYRELLHGGEQIPPGTPFENILRRTIKRGAIANASNDPERWIAKRLEHHRNPKEPLLQKRSDGRWIMISERHTESGGVVVVYSDITELKQREATLADEREHLAMITERLNLALTMDGIGIWDVDLATGTVWWSEQYTTMLGHDPHSYIPSATAWEEHLHPAEAAATIAAVNQFLISNEETLRITRHMLDGNGVGLWFEALMHAQRDTDGKAMRLTGIDVDITEQRLKEQQLAAANSEIKIKHKELETLSAKLAKYLSPQVYDSIFAGRQEVKIVSSRKKLTVFFSDIVNFTELADKLESEDLTQLLNNYLTEMSRVALEHGATIDKYVGDAIVIFFGDPESRGVKEDALACVRMAITMKQRLQTLQNVWHYLGIEQPIRCRIGISTAFCTVGNFGSEDRMDYTIIGSAVNLAARLEQVATPGSILISYETYALIKEHIYCEERGQIDVKGIAHPVNTFEVIDEHENLPVNSRQVREHGPHATINLDINAMTEQERHEIATLLTSIIRQLEQDK